jgi:DNA-binding response OmpR family regulator
MEKRLLIVEDDSLIAQLEKDYLSANGYTVDVCADGISGLEEALKNDYNLIILDVMLPGMNGYEVATKLRKEKIATPILMLTAKDQVADKVKGLDSGADDYMTKPFDPEELLARIRALTRRQGEVVIDELSFEGLKLNLSTCDLICNDKSVHLNFKEFEIMKIFLSSPGIVVTKDELIVKVWGYDSNAVDNNVEVYISFLRKKLEFIGSSVEIASLRKIGYRLEVKSDA